MSRNVLREPRDGMHDAGQTTLVRVDAWTDAWILALPDYGPLLLATARSILDDPFEAEDVVQATFEIALRERSSLRDLSATRAWLLRIETREAFRFSRRLRRLVPFDVQLHDGAGSLCSEQIELRDALSRLPTRERAAVVLHYIVGLTVADTAGALGTSENTVKTQLRLGLERVRKEWDR
jgi:RNA polymerase sigma-70 factor (ECF subfamily)